MILKRLSIRGKLNLLLILALAAVLLVATPFVASQVNNARSAGLTADTARHARELGGLVWELQRERLLTAAYLASPDADSVDLVAQQRIVDDTANDVRSSLGPQASDELASALVRLGSLQEPRQNALHRGISPDGVARTYHAVISAVIDALRLVPQRTSDAEGTRQLTALDALLRANEHNALRGMALIAAAVDRPTGQVILDNASAQGPMFTERFVQQADVEHAALVVLVDQGEAARRVDALADRLPAPSAKSAVPGYVADVRVAVESQSNLRRFVQDQVTSQITEAAAGRADASRLAAWVVGLGAAALLALVAVLALAVSRSIANPLGRLTTAATTVADLAEAELVRVTDTEETDEQMPRFASIDVSTRDEVGKLAAAFNRVQSTATLLVERQAITRRNVSLMFSNVAQRTQNLVGRQLTLVDELERNEQDARVLASLYRLDHLSTRLRRTADNLLVVAGTRDETKITGPTELATALRSAVAEIEDYKRVRLGEVAEILLASALRSDLVLVFAELLENATSFSPPESFVEVDSTFLPDGSCEVSIVDHGIGMTPERLAEENRRLVERERLDVAPTSVLGLFVVGRLARRHSLTVQLAPTEGRGITARVAIPTTLFSRITVPQTPAERPAQAGRAAARRSAGPSPLAASEIPTVRRPKEPSWFATTEPAPAPEQVAETVPAARAESSRSGLKRRVPGAQLPEKTAVPKPTAPPGHPKADRPPRDAAAARATFNGYQAAILRAIGPLPAESAVVPPLALLGPSGLSRRIPGANLAPSLRKGPARGRHKRAAMTVLPRDPNAERAAFDAFTTGFARAAAVSADHAGANPGPGDAAATTPDTHPTEESKV